MKHYRTIIALVAAVTLVKGCGDGDSPTEPPRPTTVAVSPARAELMALGETVQLTAEVRDQNAGVMAGTTVTWSSTGVATVDASGLVTAAGNGTASIMARAGEALGTAVVTVMQSVVSVEVSPSTETITALGSTLQLAAEAFDENGHAVAGTEFLWESSDGAVVTVDSLGLVTAVENGEATITARAGNAEGTAVVTVMQSAVSVEVLPSAERIDLGDTLQLTAEAFDGNGHAVAGTEFSWESSDAVVATVDASGLVTAAGGYGEATITAMTGEASGTAVVTVADLEREALVALYHATGGPNWVNAENWLTDAPLGDWNGVNTDASGRVVQLNLLFNNLSGPVPNELGDLTGLARLNLTGNNLSGPIPPELGSLTSLSRLWLADNNLTGSIPPELSHLNRLIELALRNNNLTGPIPPELGDLTRLARLLLHGNNLSGPIPPELGRLTGTTSLDLSRNNLTGPIPPELGSLASLRVLRLDNNQLRGPIPREFENLTNLVWLTVENNTGLAGSLPFELTILRQLGTLLVGGTDLCAPTDPGFQSWLRGIRQSNVPPCALSVGCDPNSPGPSIAGAMRDRLPPFPPPEDWLINEIWADIARQVPGGWGGFIVVDDQPVHYLVYPDRKDEALAALRTLGVTSPFTPDPAEGIVLGGFGAGARLIGSGREVGAGGSGP